MSDDKEATIATIALRQVRVTRSGASDKTKTTNLMNRLVPYLDLFGRLDDEEIARLALVPTEVATGLRQQVISVDRALERFSDLVPRLSDSELVRLTGATPKTVRFWRLCQPRWLAQQQPNPDRRWSVADAAQARAGSESSEMAESPLDSGAPISRETDSGERPRGMPHDSSELPAVGSSEDSGVVTRHDSSDNVRSSGSMPYRMPEEERDGGRARRNPSSPGTFLPPPQPQTSTAPQPTVPAAPSSPERRSSPDLVGMSGTPFPGYEHEPDGNDGVFIGLELPDSRPMS